MKREQLISIFFIALLIFIIYQTFSIFSPFVKAIFWSAILAFAFYPLHDLFKKYCKMNDSLSALLVTIVIFLIVIPPVVILAVNVTGQAIELYQATVNYIRSGNLQTLIDQVRSFNWIQKIEQHIVEWDILRGSLENWILTSTKALGNFTASQVGTISKNTFFLGLNVFLMVFLIFVFIKDGHKIYKFFYDVAPLDDHAKQSIFGHINKTFGAVIRGQLLTSLVQAILAGVMFYLLGIPLSLLFALATFITALIPVIGASGIWLPLAIYLFLQQAHTKALILFLFGVLVISLVDNVLKPAIIGERTRLPYILLFFGILGGIKAYGLMGIFLAPVILTLFFALIKIYQQTYR